MHLTHLVHVQHVQIDFAQLMDVGMAEGFARPDVGFKNVSQLFDSLKVFQKLDILRGLGDNCVPHLKLCE